MKPPRPDATVVGRRALLVGGLLAGTAALTGCAEQGPRPADARGTIVSANGTITEWPKGSRPPRVDFRGRTDSGAMIRSSELLGEVALLNFWYAACPPCRAEAPDLQALWQRFRGDGVRFVGVNVRDGAAEAQAFARQFRITYPSIVDSDSSVQLAFAGTVSVQAVPTTLLLDRQGRPAARIVGRIPARGVLNTLLKDLVAERARP